jgi:UDP-galactopyranose mutase
MTYDYLIVGAGLFGSVIAERIANDLNKRVLVIDRREHIGGNCYSYEDKDTGIECHLYGTHIFHTTDQDVWRYITQFTEFNGYHHQVLTKYQDKVYQMPINLETINSFYNRSFTPREAREFIAQEVKKENIEVPRNLEEKAISAIGRPLYEAFIKGYTIKQWEKDPKELSASIINRLPIRFDYREDYFHDCRWQGIPIGGYTKIFDRLLSSPNIEVRLNCDYMEHKYEFNVKEKTVFTGRLDQFFGFKYGVLDWRSVDLRREVIDYGDFQGTSVMNYAESNIPYTRIHEPRHLHPEREYQDNKTVIFYETSRMSKENDSYYPVNDDRNLDLSKKYFEDAQKEEDVIFGGRLGEYAYYDMDKTILSALKCYNEQIVAKSEKTANA